ncbi:MAG: filamentous hemagglutinin N-terminal domain-containing protein [Cyanobacteria bacterium P01_F01_bin.143]
MNDQRLNSANLLGIKSNIGNKLCLATVSYLLLSLGANASAQVIPDNSLPSSSLVNQDGDLIEILQGTTVEDNIFHSFEQFSIIQGETAWFQNATTIDNIFTRVTGDSGSFIDGLIRANGTANLFFLNPNGIIFGANSQLDIGGSFVGTTADSFRFSNGSEFSAIDPQLPPLLTVNIAPGLQYGTGNGEIVVQGQGNLLAFTPNLFVDRSFRPNGLEVDTGKTLALVGNNIFVEGGNLTAESGNIELGSVGDNSFVQLSNTDIGLSSDYTEVSNFQDIILSQAASLDVSGNNGGDVQLQGKEVIITDGSAILADTFGDRDGGIVQVNASELLVVAGTAENSPFISRLSTDVLPGAIGNGGDIELNTGNLIITGGAQVLSSSYSSGNTGNIKVAAENVELASGSRFASSSGLFTLVFGSGNGGDLDIAANSISVLDGAQAAALTFGNGQGGNLNVNANSIDVVGTSPNGISSSLATNSQGVGNGGQLEINSESLFVANGGSVESSVFRSGNGGDLIVNVKKVELFSGAPGVGPSGLFANVEREATGSGGNLTIAAESLSITDGAQATVTTFGSGSAGVLNINADEIELIGTSPTGFGSGVFSNIEELATGNGGAINIEAEQLIISDGAEIASTNNSLDISSLGGSIKLKVDEIELVGGSVDAASGLFTTVQSQALGTGGNLTIDTDSLTVKDGAQIAVSTRGLGNGGELDIQAKTIEIIGTSEFGASGILGNAVEGNGNGGNITVTSNDLKIRDGATINVSNFLSSDFDNPGTGKAGSISINSQNIEIDGLDSNITAATFDGGGGNIVLSSDTITTKNGAQVTAETSGVGNGGSITISANEFNITNQAQVSVNSTGEGKAGDIAIASENITLDEGQITATSKLTGGGDITLEADFTDLDNNSLISTSVTDSTGGGGDLRIDSDYIIANHDSDLEANAILGSGGNIYITTNAIFFSANSEATASSKFGVDGVVEINNPNADEQIGVVPLKFELAERTEIIPSFCSTDSTNTMVVSGKGGLSDNPGQTLRGQSVWEDLRDFDLASNDNNAIAPTTNSEHNGNADIIVEANNWRVNDQGKVELVSQSKETFNLCKKY